MSNKNFRVKNGLEVAGSATIDDNLTVSDNLDVNGTFLDGVTLETAFTFGWDENDNRANRPGFKASSGDTTGVRILAPNTTSGATSLISLINTSDIDNNSFINFQARSGTNPIRIQTGEIVSGVSSNSTKSVAFTKNDGTAYATVNPAGTTIDTDVSTKIYTDGAITTAIANLVDSAPTTLDTLNELAAALGDDPNYATTITTALGTKLATADFTSTADTWLGTKSTSNLAQGTNLYYTDALARAAVSAGTGISYSSATGVITSTITQYTDALARASLSGTAPIGYNTTTGAITFTPTATNGGVLTADGTTWVNSIAGIGNQYNLNRNSTGATGSNNILALTKTRTDGARTNGQGPFQIFNYTGTDGGYNFARLSTGYQSGGAHTMSFATSTDATGAFGAGTSTPLTFSKASATFTIEGGFLLTNRTGAVSAQVPAQQLRYSRTDQTGPQDNDGVDFRLGVGGTATNTNVGRVDAVYKSSGLNEIGLSVSADSFAADTDRIYIGTRESTKILATPTGGGTVSTIMDISNARILNNRPHRGTVTTATLARGGTYTPAVGVNNFIELTLTAGTDPTYIDVDNLTVAGEGGHQAILVYNNSGTAVGNGDLVIRNNGTAINSTQDTIANGARVIFTVYCVGNYASCEYMIAA